VLCPAARAADVPISDEARTHFAAGVALLQDPKAPRYEDAYREFKAAYAASPSYRILGNLGLCAMKIERDAEAIEAFETYLKEAGPELTQAEREQMQRDLLTLKAGIVRVTVSSNPPGASIVDVRTPIEGNDVRNAYGPVSAPLVLGLRRGRHVITARLSGYLDQQWEFEASGTTLPAHVFAMVRPAASSPAPVAALPRSIAVRPVPTAAWVSGAATLGLAATGAVFGVTALQKHSDFNSVNDGLHVSEATSDRNSGETLNRIADGFFAGAALAGVVTTYLVLARPTVERPVGAGDAATGPMPRVTPMAGKSTGLAALWVF
jgi:hypothetical protein